MRKIILQFKNSSVSIPLMDNPKLKQLITDLASDFKPSVEKIEGKFATTQNHYGDYMALLSTVAKTKQHALLFGLALKEAGANSQGVNDALKVMGYI